MTNFRALFWKIDFCGVYMLLNCGNNQKWTEDTSRNKSRGVSEIPWGGVRILLSGPWPMLKMYCWRNYLTLSYLDLQVPFNTIARHIKIDMLEWWPSWKSIWLPSQYPKIYLIALVQKNSFATEMNFLSLLVLEIWRKTCFRRAAILKSKMEDECMGAPKFCSEIMFLKSQCTV